MAKLSTGNFDQVVLIERPVTSTDAVGGVQIDSWSPVDEVFANVTLPTPRLDIKEVAEGDRRAIQRIAQFVLRYPVDLADGDRIVWEAEPYRVEGFAIDRQSGELTAWGVFLSGTDAR